MIALHANGDSITYFDSFLVEYNEKFIGNKNITKKFYRIQENDSTMCGYFCIRFIDFMLESKNFLFYSNSFPRNEYWKTL